MANVERRGNAQELRDIMPEPKGKLWLSYWQNAESLVAHAESLKDGADSWSKGAWTNGESFTGTKDMAEAVRLCREGWPEGAARVARLRDRINAANPIGPRLIKWDVAGAIPSVPRMLAGNPLSMRRIDSARLRRKPVLTLLSDMSANGGVAHEAITNRAAVVAAIIDAIEAKGFACHVVTFECSAGNGVTQVVAATVKESGVQSDIGSLAFSLGHASMFRRISWAAFTEDKFTSPLGSGLGVATNLDMTQANERGVYILRSPNDNSRVFKSEDSAATDGLNWLVESLRSQGCPAFPKDDSQAA